MAYNDPYYGVNSYANDILAQQQQDEEERRRREEEARAQLGQPKSTTIVNNNDGTQTVKTTHELDPAASTDTAASRATLAAERSRIAAKMGAMPPSQPVAPGSFDPFGNPVAAGSAAEGPDPTGQIAAYQEQQRQEQLARQQQLVQAEQQRRMAEAEAARRIAEAESGAAPTSNLPAAPAAPVVPTQMPTRPGQQVGGVDSAAIYQRMLQQESGNKDYLPNGKPVTSSAGALFAAQVLPSTAANPGYGIKPAASQTPEEYNRVGREYFAAMMNKYGGDPYRAAAAYNAGPGRVDKIIAANGGELPLQYLPKETQKYLQAIKIGPGNQQALPTSGAISPEQVASAVPGVDSKGYRLDAQGRRLAANGRPLDANGQEIPGEAGPLETGTVPSSRVAPLEVAPPAWRDLNDDVMKENIRGLAQGMGSQDPALRRASGEALESMLNQKRGVAEAAKKIETLQNAPNPGLVITKELTKKSGDEGSYMKMFLYQLMNWTGLAKDEAIKLGMGTKFETGMRVNDAGQIEYGLVKVDGRGTPLSGIKADGTDMTYAETVSFATQATGQKGLAKADVSTQDVEMGGMKGRVVTQNLPGGMTRTYVESGGRQYPYSAGWKPVSIATAAAKVDYATGADLYKKYNGNVIDMWKEYQTEKGPQTEEQKQQFFQQYGAGKSPIGAPGTSVAAPSAAGVVSQAAPSAAGAIAPEQIVAAQPAAPAAAIRPVAPSAVATGGGGVATGGVATGGSIADMKQARRQAEEAQKAALQVSVNDQNHFNDFKVKEVAPKAATGLTISRIRDQQLNGPDGLLNVPEIAGIMSGGGSAGTEVAAILRDMITGQFTSVDDLDKRVVGLNLQSSNPRAFNALKTQIQLQRELQPLTIKETAPVGAISDAEQKMNNKNQVDILANPAYVSVNLLSKNKFIQDQQQARNVFAAQHQELTTTTAFTNAWSKELAQLNKQYDDIYAARSAYIGQYGNTPKAALAGYKLFPVPSWNGQSQTWEYKGQPYAQKRPGLDSFVK